MRSDNFWIAYVLVFFAQLMLSNYFVFTPWISVSLLPAMILSLPLNIGTVAAMLIAFASGLGVDFLAEGVIGLNALAIVPVAFAREWILSTVFGSDLMNRNKSFSIKRNGLEKVIFATFIGLVIFMAIYVWADAAGTRSFGFNLGRTAASILTSIPFCLLAIRALSNEDKR